MDIPYISLKKTWRFQDSDSGGGKNISLLNVRIGFWAYSAFWLVFTWGSFSGNIAAGVDHLPSSSAQVKIEWSYTPAPLYAFVALTETTFP
jgi:hypothetical protein